MSTRKETKSGKVACETPGCRKMATSIVHVSHIRSWGKLKDLYHCGQHASDGSATLVSSNPTGYRAEDERVVFSPLHSEVWGHRITEVHVRYANFVRINLEAAMSAVMRHGEGVRNSCKSNALLMTSCQGCRVHLSRQLSHPRRRDARFAVRQMVSPARLRPLPVAAGVGRIG